MDAKGKRFNYVAELQQLASNPGSVPDATGQLRLAFQQLCFAHLQGDVPIEQVRQLLKPLSPLALPTLHDTLADVLWWCGCEADKAAPERKRRYFDLVRLAAENLLPQDLLVERLDLAGLEAMELADPKMRKEYTRRVTHRLYVPSKFNLLRESSEGYAKLLTHSAELHTNGAAGPSQWLQLVRVLLGYFKLDPYRVYALLQDVWEQDVQGKADAFLPALKEFPPAICPVVAGFKMGRRERPGTEVSPVEVETGHPDPNRFYQLVALMIGHGMMGLADVYHHLIGPETEKVEAKGRLLLGLLRGKMYEPALELLALAAPWSFGGAKDMPLLQELLTYCGGIVEGLYRLHCPGYAVLGRARAPANASPTEAMEKLKSYGVGIMCHIGPHFAHNVPLFTKLCRVLAYFLTTKDPELEALTRVIVASVLLPSLTVTAANPALNFEVWQVLSQYEFTKRFEMYGPLRDQVWDGSLAEIRKVAHERMEDILQAITGPIDAKYIKRQARRVGQLVQCHPMLVTDRLVQYVARTKGELSASLLDLLVRLVQYFTPLGLDILVFQLLLKVAELSSALQGKKADDSARVAEDSVALNNVARFTGALYRRHFTVLDVAAFLQFLQRRLRAGEGMDVLLLDQLIQAAVGTRPGQGDESAISIADMQLFVGGPRLRAYHGTDLLYSKASLLSSGSQLATKALLQALTANGVGRSLVLLLGQLRAEHFGIQDVDRVTMAAPLLPRFDQINDTLHTLTSFLGYADTLVSAGTQKGALIRELGLCPADQLVAEYGLDWGTAFAVVRPTLPTRPLWQEADLASVLGPAAPRLLPGAVRRCPFSTRVFFLFWTMDLKDLLPCTEAYKTTMQDLQQEISKERSKVKDACVRAADKAPDGTVDGRRLAAQLQLKEAVLQGLTQEGNAEKAAFEEGQQRLYKLVDGLSSSPPNDAERCVWMLLQECLLPRCLISAVDATYCARFVHFLHKLDIPLSTMGLVSTILTSAPYWLMCVTVKEAHRIGRFVSMVGTMMLNWRQDPESYADACAKSVGFREDMGDAASQMSHERFCSAHRRMHERLAQAFDRCLEGGEWHQQRNCIVALKMLHPVFPLHYKNYTTILAAIGPLKAHVNESLRELAKDYAAMLSRQSFHEAIDSQDAADTDRDRGGRNPFIEGDRDDRGRSSTFSKRRSRADSPSPSSKKYAADDKGKPTRAPSRQRHRDSPRR
eukprot:EG_transcript_821